MNSKLSALLVTVLTGAVAVPLLSSTTEAVAPMPASYEVRVTNLTRGQILSPVLLANHDRSADLFEAGESASGGLALLAEEGDASLLAAALMNDPGVSAVRVGSGVLPPGASETFSFDATTRHLSMATMLVVTNDAFAGLDAVLLPEDSLTLYAPAYDAGTERNSERCEYIPGPPCGSGGAHDPAPAEGFVHVHPGFRGVGSLAAHPYDWRNPVAKIEIRRVN